MIWKVRKTPAFDNWWKKEKVDDGNFKHHAQALAVFENVPVPNDKRSLIFQTPRFQCWVTRLPDKVRRQGSSEGFRVVLILDIEDKTLLLMGIFRRKNLDFRQSTGKYQNQYDDLIADLKNQFAPRS